MRRIVVTLLLSLGFTACTFRGCGRSRKDVPPEDQLYQYISTAVNVTVPQQRADLVELTTGAMKTALVSASEESFKRAYIDRKYEFKSFEILGKNLIKKNEMVTVEFKLVYKTWLAGESAERAPVQETKNRAILVYEYGRWAISRIEGLETKMDWESGIPMDNVSTKGVSPNDPPVEINSSREGPIN